MSRSEFGWVSRSSVMKALFAGVLGCALILFPPRPAVAQQLTKSQLLLNLMGKVPDPGSKAETELIKRLDAHFQSGGCAFGFSSSHILRFQEAGASKRLIDVLTGGKSCSKIRKKTARRTVKNSETPKRKTKTSDYIPSPPERFATGLTVAIGGLGLEGYQPNIGLWLEYAIEGLAIGASFDFILVDGSWTSGGGKTPQRPDAAALGWIGYQLALDEARRALVGFRVGLGVRSYGSDMQFTGALGPGVVILVGDDAGAYLRLGVDAYLASVSSIDDDDEAKFDFTEVTPSVRFGMYF